MAIDSELITKLVKVTNDTPPSPKENIVYGTIKLLNGIKYVQIDGSEIYTPVKFTVDAIAGDRVMVMIKDHKAVVSGDITSIAARQGQVSELSEHVAEFDGDVDIINSRIDVVDGHIEVINSELIAHDSAIEAVESNITILNSEVEMAGDSIHVMTSEINTLNTQMTAVNADIDVLDSAVDVNSSDIQIINSIFTIDDGVITGIHGIDADYINVTNASMDIATIQKLFADSGIIKDVYSQDSYVTGVLCGVTIVGDSVQAGTLKADRLVIKGEDGLYYKLNTEGITGEQYDEDDEPIPQTEYNSLNGAVIAAKSVTAEKIVATDLVAFGATIAGFHIVADAMLNGGKLFSGSKSDITDTTNPGIYMDATGQLCIGDSRNFVRYYKDQNDQFRLDIRADSVSFTGIDDIQDKLGRINVGTESGIPFIELSADGSDFKLRVTNSRISFIQGSSEVAWISNQKLYIEQAEIRDELRFGNFVWALHGSGTNKNMGLMWKE